MSESVCPRSVRIGATIVTAAFIAALAGCGRSNSDASATEPNATGTTTPPADPRGQLSAVNDVGIVSKDQSDANATAENVIALTGPALCDVRVQQLVHRTVGPRNEPATNSAALLTPRGPGCNGPFPLLAYARGTSKDRSRTLASTTDRETLIIINTFAARGYVVVATDYLGYGASDFSYHPYLHAGSEATSVIDSIRAARAALRSAAVATTDKVFLTGYSQGGHAALAAQREIERTSNSDITLAAVGAMSGPYDLALTLETAPRSLLPSLGNEPPNPSQRIRIELVNLLGEIAGLFVDIDPIKDALARESVIDFKPAAPVLLCGGSRDPTVPFANSTRALAAFSGTRTTLVDIEQEPAFASRRPAPTAPVDALGDYHARVVPPLCAQVVRDRLFEPLR